MRYELVTKPHFLHQLQMVPPNQTHRILEKVAVLQEDPTPDGKLKKKLNGYKSNVYRLRSGDYRVLYSYGKGIISLLGVDQRKDVYRGTQLVEAENGFTTDQLDFMMKSDLELLPERKGYSSQAFESPPVAVTKLPQVITGEMLHRLHISVAYYEKLQSCTTVEDLCAVDVPESVRNKIFDVLVESNYDLVVQEPDLAAGDIDNLYRFVNGELLEFLLKLSPEQEKLAYWSLSAAGPTLLKGGPGTGKTTIAMHRVKAIVEAHRARGVRNVGAGESPRILFTTYTNALVAYCKQQLQHLLGSGADYVSVRTADSIVREVLTGAQEECRPSHETVKRRALSNALAHMRIDTHPDSANSIARLSHDYLLEEFDGVIEAREIASIEDYLAAPRAGRVVGLRSNQRKLIWTTYKLFCQELKRLRLSTWPQLRRRAAEIIRSDNSIERYDAVIIDEAQDLDPTVLRLLTALCKTPRRVFIAADANQSVYGSSFRWSDVHEDLKVRGRTATITTNHRSTCEIGDAAHSYLQSGILEVIDAGHSYSRHGSKPVVYTAKDQQEEADALAAYVRRAVQSNRVGLGSCAVLVPSHASGQSIAMQLRSRKVPAQFMTSKELDLDQPIVKILPLKTSKGLEFPVVAIAGYAGSLIKSDVRPSEEREELLGSLRRTLFVAMTRAMRDLFVIIPAVNPPPELEGFDETFWLVNHSR